VGREAGDLRDDDALGVHDKPASDVESGAQLNTRADRVKYRA
jgi:hypothetical protein